MAEKSRSETARLITKVVVAWDRSLAHRNRATTVTRLPATPTTVNIEAATAAKMVLGLEKGWAELVGSSPSSLLMAVLLVVLATSSTKSSISSVS